MAAGLARKACLAGGIALAGMVALLAVAALVSSRIVEAAAHAHVYENLQDLPQRNVGLVLGTSRNRGSGLNEFYLARINAAAKLFHEGKIRHIIVSGSNPSRYYNEPGAMKKDLVERTVPGESITLDHAGFRTLDSVIRADKVMGQRSLTVVSQCFHVKRAIFLARHFGLDTIGYCAEDPSATSLYSSHIREYGARLKAVLDVSLLNTQPRVLGDPVSIPISPS